MLAISAIVKPADSFRVTEPIPSLGPDEVLTAETLVRVRVNLSPEQKEVSAASEVVMVEV
jgi:hypothetical protein